MQVSSLINKLSKSILFSTYFSTILIVIVSFIVAGIIMSTVGVNPLEAYWAMAFKVFGTKDGWGETLVLGCPLLLAGIGLIFAFRCGVFNIGAEGQLQMGALGATWAGISLAQGSPVPPTLHLPIMILMGFAFGAVWAAIPAILRAKRGVNEILTTLLMNYIAISLVYYSIMWLWKDPTKWYATTYDIAPSAELPILIPATRVHSGFLIAIILAIITYLIFKKTSFGYSIRALGSNPDAARHAGINVSRMIIIVMLISGGLAGIAGMAEVAGVHHNLVVGFSPEYGYTAIAVALLGGLNGIGVVIAALFFGGLMSGSYFLQRATGLSTTFVMVIIGIVVLFTLAREFIIRKLRRGKWGGVK